MNTGLWKVLLQDVVSLRFAYPSAVVAGGMLFLGKTSFPG